MFVPVVVEGAHPGAPFRSFEALWVQARLLDPDFPSAWEEDIEPDLAVARTLNGLPPDA